MSNIGGAKREAPVFENKEFTKRVGLFEASVVAINPTIEEYKDILNMELKEDSKATEYVLDKDDTYEKRLRVDIWLKDVKKEDFYKLTYFLENKERVSNDGLKKQYINNIGSTCWSADENDLPEWFAKRDYRVARKGEEDFYNFLRSWLSNIDYREASAALELDWSKLMKGNTKDLRDQIGGEYSANVVALATVKSVEKNGETKAYQNVYSKAFLPAYSIRQFRIVDYTKPSLLNDLRAKKSKDLKPHERFVLNVMGEYGCKDFFTLKDIADYNPEENLVSSDRVIADDDSDY